MYSTILLSMIISLIMHIILQFQPITSLAIFCCWVSLGNFLQSPILSFNNPILLECFTSTKHMWDIIFIIEFNINSILKFSTMITSDSHYRANHALFFIFQFYTQFLKSIKDIRFLFKKINTGISREIIHTCKI